MSFLIEATRFVPSGMNHEILMSTLCCSRVDEQSVDFFSSQHGLVANSRWRLREPLFGYLDCRLAEAPNEQQPSGSLL